MSDLAGKRIAHYDIVALLGEGGMGAVYRARDMKLGREVALKVMHGQYARQSAFQQRFLREAQSAAQLDHPSIVTIHSFDSLQDTLYIDMELVPGLTLGDHIKQLAQRHEVPSLRETLYLLAQVADALGYAHRRDVIHRDIKPGNVLVRPLDRPEQPGNPPLRAVVTDFGLAKLQTSATQTASGTLMGTLPYMSPEQIKGRPLDGRSDLYSLGIVLYQLTAGRLPFEIQSISDAVEKHVHEPLPPPRSMQPGLPQAIEAVIVKALAKKPGDRYQTGEEMADAIRAATEALTDEEITNFVTAAPGTMVSLVTRLAPQRSEVGQPTQMGQDLVISGAGDQVVISRKGETPTARALDKLTLTLGRSANNDIVLDASEVSRNHARLEKVAGGGWQVIDLNSTNGVLLGSDRLLPDIPQRWQPEQTMRIGPFFLQLRQRTAGQLERATSLLQQTYGGTQVRSFGGELELLLAPTDVTVAAGGRQELQVEIFNQGKDIDHFLPALQGLPREWYTLPAEAQRLMPGAAGQWSLFIHPPRHSSAHAGKHRFQLEVTPEARPQEKAAVTGSVTVEPFEQLTVYPLDPQVLRGAGQTRVRVQNGGNYESTVAIEARDPENAVRVETQTERLTVPAGAEKTAVLQVQPKRRLWFGSTRVYPYEVQVQGAKATQRVQGQVEARPLLPVWLLTALIFLCAVSVVAASLFWTNRARATAGRNATATSIALVGDADQDGIPDLREIQLGTDPKKADSDGDGLNDKAELDSRTDPLNPDTDADGLVDGAETNVYLTNPLNPDHDGDGLSDGDEVNQYSTDPRIRDTDGDGASDKLEIDRGSDPGQLPTPVPSATPNLAATETAVASNQQATVAADQTRAADDAAQETVAAAPGKTSEALAMTQTAEASATQVALRRTAEAAGTLTAIAQTAEAAGTGTAIAVAATETAQAIQTAESLALTLTAAAKPVEVTIDVLTYSPSADWATGKLTESLDGTTISSQSIPWMGPEDDDRGFVRLSTIDLEDGTSRLALRTHPQWVEDGTIKGFHRDLLTVTMPENAVFEAQVGFVRGATGTDGVNFVVFEHHFLPDGRESWNRVAELQKGYTGRLETIRADLSQFAGQSIYLELRVDAGSVPGSSAARDWAVWVDPVIKGTRRSAYP